MYIEVDRKDKRPIWLQIVDQVIDYITRGQLSPGDPLVPTRQLAQELSISRSSVQIAYEELQSRGYVATSRRGGTKVCQLIPETNLYGEEQSVPAIPPNPFLEEKTDYVEHWPDVNQDEKAEIDFRLHEPYVDPGFQKSWRRASNTAMRKENVLNWGYSSPYGLYSVREQISRYLAIERGIYVKPEQILLTLGARQTMDIIAQALLQEGDLVSVEDPGFPVAWSAMRYRNMNVEPVPIDSQGLCVEHISPDSKMIFTTPSHQFPSGVLMTANRRQELIQFARENQTWIIEDDYDGEFRYRGGPMPSLFSQMPTNILYLLSFTKLLAPGIRLAAVIGPEEAIARMAKVQEFVCRHLPVMEQLALGQFFETGDLLKHVRRMRSIYHRRHKIIIQALTATGLADQFHVQGTESGLHVLLESGEDFDESRAVQSALNTGVGVFPLSPYCLKSKRKGLLLGFAHLNSNPIVEGVNRLAKVLKK
ncbi:MocR-like pyridoxine biosynthesis transcription factor PdxR [Bacillus benzoevorans]|uniref:GntR family transcriptional regulator/MocR family aminotransferase n=1 Tax=Bacillus benzoevorans TaxID=1456 RepID=A0A7X0HW27_9BACI|nr:PLP-dependent aminotransferase family protein [Bacillus benzoevorans]MBB6446987.1 GntR family transcriptional regulator/MocR family aminotransferase [Bacillus benzoevorans]